MRNSWFMWVFIVGVVVSVLIAFNYQGGKTAVPLSDIFPDEVEYPVDIEYEFVETEAPTAVSTVADVVPVIVPAVEKAPVVETVSPVKPSVSVAKKTETKSIVTTAAPQGQYYTIQVASFKTQGQAEDAQKKLAGHSIEAYIVKKDLAEKGVWYRLYVGQFDSKEKAQASLGQVNKIYSGSFVIFSK